MKPNKPFVGIKMKGNVKFAMEIANLVILLQFVSKDTIKEVEQKIAEITNLLSQNVIKLAIENKLLSKTEYEKKFKGKYVENNIDSFPTLIGFVLGGNDIFVTQSKKMYKDREKIYERFGIEVLNQDIFMQQAMKEQNEKNKPPSYVG